MAKRSAKLIQKKSDIDEILALTHDKACERNTVMSWFADFGDGPRFNPYDKIVIPKGLYGADPITIKLDSGTTIKRPGKKNKNEFTTTVGLWLFNKMFIEPLSDVLGYYNESITADVYDDINKELSYALLEERITIQELKDFIMQSQVLMSCASSICPSHTMNMLLITNDAEKKKKELEKKYAKELAAGDLTAMKAIEDELIAFAKDKLKDEESVDMYNSGARSSWGNNFKNMYLIKGPVKLTDESYHYVHASYISGLDKEDFAATNDSAVGGPYSRSRMTALGGFDERRCLRATQHIKILPKGSNCGTKKYITVTLTNKNIKDWMYSFIIEGSKLVELTSENRDKYIGKTVKMRYSSLCESKNGICEACTGTLMRRLNIDNAGLVAMVMMSSVKNKAMSAFHDSSLDLAVMDVNKAFSLE